MKNYIAGLFTGMLILTACAMGGKPYDRPERGMAIKDFVACRKPWMAPGVSHVGKLCNRYCEKRGKKEKGRLIPECKKWKTTVKNFSVEKDFNFFHNGDYKCSRPK